MSISGFFRLLMLWVANGQRLPFATEVPNAATRRAMQKLELGKGKAYASTNAMMKDLGM